MISSDDPQLQQVRSGDLQGFGGHGGLAGIAPKDGGTGFRAGHGVDAVLEHQQAIGDPDPEGAPGATFSDHGGQDRDPQSEHLPQVDGDGFPLPLLFGQQSGVGPPGCR